MYYRIPDSTTMSILTRTTGLGIRGGSLLADGFARHNCHVHHWALSRGLRKPCAPFSSADTTASDAAAAAAADGTRLFPEEINVLYDSKCDVCRLEMEWLAARDLRLHGPRGRRLRLTDLEGDGFDAADPRNGGVDYARGMAGICAVGRDGTVHTGVSVFEVAYGQVGLGWIWRVARIPVVRGLLERCYEIFARHRTRVTRGASLEELLALHAAKKRAEEGEDCEACQHIQTKAS